MLMRLLRHMTVGGIYYFGGTTLPLSVLDKVMDDGRLVYHYGDKFDIIPADAYKIVYSSFKEMEEETAKKKEKK